MFLSGKIEIAKILITMYVHAGRDQEEFRGKWFQSNCMPCTNAGPVCQALDCDGGMHHILFVHLHWL
jgi:hypothetical protein